VTRAEKWAANIARHEAWVAATGSLPALTANPGERASYLWARTQRSKYRDGTLAEAKVIELTALAQWRWSFSSGRRSRRDIPNQTALTLF
jgi:hypothetical protein